jgi:hypothetical protein
MDWCEYPPSPSSTKIKTVLPSALFISKPIPRWHGKLPVCLVKAK